MYIIEHGKNKNPGLIFKIVYMYISYWCIKYKQARKPSYQNRYIILWEYSFPCSSLSTIISMLKKSSLFVIIYFDINNIKWPYIKQHQFNLNASYNPHF